MHTRVSTLAALILLPMSLHAQVGALAAIPAIAYGSREAKDILKELANS